MTDQSPFQTTTTEGIERANRFLSLRGHPAFADLVRLSQSIVEVARQSLLDYQGWDKDELVARAIGLRAAQRFHDMLFGQVADEIRKGVVEAQQRSQDPGVSDHLRDLAMKETDQRYGTSVAGMYEKTL